MPTRVGRLAVIILVVVAAVVAVVAVRWSDDSDARAAHAEFLVVRAALERAEASAAEARELVRRATPADRPAAERIAGDAERAVREADEHARLLRAEWGRRWRRLGLVAD
jgi:hypothetical protein